MNIPESIRERTRIKSHVRSSFVHFFNSLLTAFICDTSGATAIEYAMVAAGISVAIVSAVNLLGQNVNSMFFAKIAAAM